MLYEASRGGEEGKRQLKRDAVVQRHSTVLQNINKGTYEKPLIHSNIPSPTRTWSRLRESAYTACGAWSDR